MTNDETNPNDKVRIALRGFVARDSGYDRVHGLELDGNRILRFI